MKKALPIIVLLAVVAVAGFFAMKRRGGSGGGGSEKARTTAVMLAPAETAVFLELPNIYSTVQRWKETGLYHLGQEPEWQAFVAKWDEFAKEDEILPFFSILVDIKKADPDGFFVAVTDLSKLADDDLPPLVGGFSHRAKKTDVESVVRQFKDRLFGAWPDAKSDLSKHGEIDIETITKATATVRTVTMPPVKASLNGRPVPPAVAPQNADLVTAYSTVLLAYCDNWVFFATDRALLTGTLDRYLRKPGAPKSLADVPLHAESLKHSAADPDLTLWARWKPLPGFFSEQIFGPSDPDLVEKEEGVLAFLYSWKLDGQLMRDRLYLHLAKAPSPPALANRALAFTTAETYAYGAIDADVLAGFAKWALTVAGEDLTDPKEMMEELGKKGLTLDDLWTTFGTEVAVISAWPENAFALWPDFLAALEVREPAKARKFVELIAEGMAEDDGVAAKVTTEGDTTRWVWDLGIGGIAKPTLVLNKTHLLVAINPATLDNALKQLKAKGPTIATKPGSEFPAALQGIAEPNAALFYLDTKTLVARAYRSLKPTFDQTLLGMPQVAKYFDYAKLPKAETFARHLRPMTIGLRTEGQGWVLESAGTLNALGPQSLFLVGGAVFAIDSIDMPPAPPTPLSKTEAVIFLLEEKLTEYEEETGALPTTAQGLSALVTQPTLEPKPAKWKQMIPALPNDAWGNPLQYLKPGKHDPDGYDLFSSGPDGKPGTGDDVGNW